MFDLIKTFFCAYVDLSIRDELCLIPDVSLVTENKLVDNVTNCICPFQAESPPSFFLHQDVHLLYFIELA